MSLQIGTQLGPYQVKSLIGKGGMGEVYRARDTKLQRDVALKLLPDHFASDPDRLARFQREAQVLASLNHTNIAQIYGLEESSGTRCIVMELVEGETIQERLKRGPIPVDDALQIAKQICEALEAADEKSIVHRDLKPANVKIMTDGKVKVLDFGLAKALEPSPSGRGQGEGFSNSPTLSMAATNAGVILGTAAYMSPEQAKGRPVDRRTDIFAFGAVLYEMLTGRPAFDGEDVTEILARVLEREPDWGKLPPSAPLRIRELLRLCLEKNATRRRQAAGDVRIDIEQALAEPLTTAPAAAPARNARLAWIVAAAAALMAAVLVIPTMRYLRESPPAAAPETRVDIVTPVTSDPVSFAISPDGRRLVFVASGASGDAQPRLWLRPLDVVTAQPMAGTEGATYPFWSPDSRSVGFFAGGKLKRVDIGGGLPQTLTNANLPRGGTWSPEGVILFAPSTVGPLFRIPASGGEAVPVTKLAGQGSHRFPQFLLGGRQFLFFVQGSVDAQGIYLGSLDAAETKRLTATDAAGLYAPQGWLLFVRQGTLVARRFDPSRGELIGDPMTVADAVGFDAAINIGAFSVSATGLVTYRAGGAGRRQLTWFDRSGKALGTLGPPDENNLSNPDLSSDGRRVAVDRSVQGNVDIWLLDAARTSRFTFDPSNDNFPLWSPDGSRIVFRSNRKGAFDLYQKPSSGAGSEELLVESPQAKTPFDWSGDSRFLLYQSVDPKTASDLWVLPMSGANASPARSASATARSLNDGRSRQELEGDRKPRVFLSTNFDERKGMFSPDGRWVAYQSNESGRDEIYVRPFPGPGGQWQISTSGGIWARWRPDGKELYYIAPDGRLMAASITIQGTTPQPGTPVALFQTRIVGGGTDPGLRQQYDIAPDGRFLINVTSDDAITTPITLLQNWKPPAK